MCPTSLAGPLLTASTSGGAPAQPVSEWFPVAFPFFFAGMWILVTTLLGWMSGHMKLLARYPPLDEPNEETFSWASGSMRGVSFNNSLCVGLGPRGLHLAGNVLFRPLFRRGVPCIPWGEVRLVRPQPGRVLALFMGSKFEIPAVDLRFTIGGAAGRAVERKISTARPGAEPPRHALVRES